MSSSPESMSSSDSAPLVVSDDIDEKDDRGSATKKSPTLLSMAVESLCNVKYKSLIFLFILFILITSDVFVNMLLKKIGGAVDDRGYATPYGTVIQGIVLVLGHMFLNFFIEKELI